MQPPEKTLQRRLGYVEDCLTSPTGDRARVERYRRRMERKQHRRDHGQSVDMLRHTGAGIR